MPPRFTWRLPKRRNPCPGPAPPPTSRPAASLRSHVNAAAMPSIPVTASSARTPPSHVPASGPGAPSSARRRKRSNSSAIKDGRERSPARTAFPFPKAPLGRRPSHKPKRFFAVSAPVLPWYSRPSPEAAAVACVSYGMQANLQRRSGGPHRKRSQRSATPISTLSDSLQARATSRCRSRATAAVPSRICSSANAACSAAIKNSSRSRPRRISQTRGANRYSLPPARSRVRSRFAISGPSNFSSMRGRARAEPSSLSRPIRGCKSSTR